MSTDFSDFLKALGPDRTISRKDLYRVLGVHYPGAGTSYAEGKERELEFLQRFKPFRRDLLVEQKMDLRPNHQGGYVVVNAADQTELAMKDTKRAVARAVGNGLARVTHVNTEGLTDEQRAQNANAQAKLGKIRALTRKEFRK